VVWECGTNAAELRLKNARVRVLKVCAWGGYRIPAIPTMRGAAMASAAPPTAARSPSPALCVLRERERGVARFVFFSGFFLRVCWCVERGSNLQNRQEQSPGMRIQCKAQWHTTCAAAYTPQLPHKQHEAYLWVVGRFAREGILNDLSGQQVRHRNDSEWVVQQLLTTQAPDPPTNKPLDWGSY